MWIFLALSSHFQRHYGFWQQSVWGIFQQKANRIVCFPSRKPHGTLLHPNFIYKDGGISQINLSNRHPWLKKISIFIPLISYTFHLLHFNKPSVNRHCSQMVLLQLNKQTSTTFNPSYTAERKSTPQSGIKWFSCLLTCRIVKPMRLKFILAA